MQAGCNAFTGGRDHNVLASHVRLLPGTRAAKHAQIQLAPPIQGVAVLAKLAHLAQHAARHDREDPIRPLGGSHRQDDSEPSSWQLVTFPAVLGVPGGVLHDRFP